MHSAAGTEVEAPGHGPGRATPGEEDRIAFDGPGLEQIP